MWQMPERRRLGTGENITRSGLTAHWDMRRRTSSVLPVINGEQLIVLMYVDKLVFSLLLRTPISSGPRNGEQPTTAYGRELLRLHRETYPRFWQWSDGAESHAMLLGRLHTVFGWTVRVGADANPRSLRNFPCQANGAEMLRLACSLTTERGISIVAPVHDAVMVEGPADSIDAIVAETQTAMAEASAVILDGFRLRSDAKI